MNERDELAMVMHYCRLSGYNMGWMRYKDKHYLAISHNTEFLTLYHVFSVSLVTEG
jgi:hypothetical protein